MLATLKNANEPIAAVEPVALASFYRQISKFSTTLIDLRDEFEGDMDRFLVYLIVLLDDVSRVSRGAGPEGRGVSALSIAEITRIPRETVRRKVSLLVASGLLRREGYAHYHVTEDGDPPVLMERFARLSMERDFHLSAAAASGRSVAPATPCGVERPAPLRSIASGMGNAARAVPSPKLRWD